MQRRFKISQVLVYYDLPELVVVTDQIGTDYISLLFDVVEAKAFYYAVPISVQRLAYFVKGKVDLRQILIEPEVQELYLLSSGDGSNAIGELQDIGRVPDEFLPDVGFFLNQEIEDSSSIVEETVTKENAVVHLGISDENDDYGIDADDLGLIINLYSGLVEKGFKIGLTEHGFKYKEKKAVVLPINYKLRAFAASRASFNVHLYSQSQKDLFGNCLIEFGLEKIDQLFSDYPNNQEFIAVLKSLKGHTISNFKGILLKIVNDKLKIKHKWFAPNKEYVSYSEIDSVKAQHIIDVLNQSTELEDEIKDVIGYFVQADVEKGTWRIRSADDGSEYNGEATQYELTGITLETVLYKLTYQEIVQEYTVTQKEKIKCIFKSVSQVED